jgi:hypothetical protein
MSLTTLISVSVLPEKKIPTASVKVDPAFGVIGSVVKLDGRLSSDPHNSPLTYTWTFDSVPIGSRVAREGFRLIDADGAVVSFSPDIVGEYVIGLTVSNGMFESEKSQAVTSIRAILVPHGRGLVPDGKWIWSYIRDVWQGVDNKEMFETLWSALLQIVGAELLKLYQVDFNKSIRDIQDLYQRRWLSYEPKLNIKVNGPNFFFGNHYAGVNASTINLGLSGLAIVLSGTEVVVIEGSVLQNVAGESFTLKSSIDPANNQSFKIAGTNSFGNGYRLAPTSPIPNPESEHIDSGVGFVFAAQSKQWSLYGAHGKPYAELMSEYGSPLDYLLPLFMQASGGVLETQVGDVIQFKTGPNKGFYRIVQKSGTSITVDRAPPSFSDETTILTHTADIYRPMRFEVTQPDNLLTDTIAIPYDPSKDISSLAPGRVIIINGLTYTIIRCKLDNNQHTPSVLITIDRPILQSGIQGLSWRTPPTLVSTTQNFEEDGVSPGDLIVFDIVQDGAEISHVPCQVVGVDRGRLGFVFTTEPLAPGQTPEVPTDTILQLANDFHIDGLIKNDDGSLTYTGQARQYYERINSTQFKRSYWNKELTPTTNISVNPNYQIKPRIISRTKLIPVDSTLRSIPLLQNYIAPQNVVERNGKFYQQRNGVEYEVAAPVFLKENIDYIIDGEYAFSGRMTFKTGSDIIEVDDGDFVDRGIGPGDQFIIKEPVTLSKTYYVQAVLGPTKLKLTREVPLYALGDYVTANVQIKRNRSGHFIRFTPGRFTAKSPAPNRLWAEVSFFDNNENIENNFGILVGLTREDVQAVSENLNYRQAVSGIMYAYLRGSSIEKVRLGAQILLGLPFAENRGIIRSIEEDYRLDIHGKPVLGRLLIEDVDNTGTPLGTLRIYTFPIEPGSELAGLETNPATGDVYKVGDIVEKFAALSKGVEITDYITNPLDKNYSTARLLQQFHSIIVRVNDNIFTLNEISLVSQFLRKITPSYIAFFVSSLSEFFDDSNVLDDIALKNSLGPNTLVDNASLCIPPTIKMDARNISGFPQIYLDGGVFWVRRVGSDLTTSTGSLDVSIPSGGILNPKAGELFESPLTKVGDRVIIQSGVNQGFYTITAIANDHTMTLDGPALGFTGEAGIRYAIVRRIGTVIRASETYSFSSGNPVVTGTGGLRVDGVSPGDWFLNINNTVGFRSRHQIIDVLESTPGSGVWDRLRISPAPTATGSDAFAIVRSKIFESPFPTVFTVTGIAGNRISVPAGTLLKGLVETGDILQEYDSVNDRLGKEHMVMDREELYLSPPIPPLTTVDVKLFKKNRPSTGIGWDTISQWDPIDVSDAAIVETQSLASCVASSTDVTLQMERTTPPASGPSPVDPTLLNIRPTDYLKLEGMASPLDIGYGAGVFPIVEVTPTLVRLSVALPTTETLPWSIIRRR